MQNALLALLFALSGCAKSMLLHAENIDPERASFLAARIVGRPELGPELARIAKREGHWLPKHGSKVHRRDSWASKRVWSKAVKRGWLNPSCQPYGGGGWSTRGSHGLMVAYHLRLVPELGPCPQASAFDRPGVSALAAARKAASVDGDCEDRTRAWVGGMRWDAMTRNEQWAKARIQCGRVPPSLASIIIAMVRA